MIIILNGMNLAKDILLNLHMCREELTDWQEPSFYISHLAVVNKKSKSTSLKGPDSFRNTILGILIRFRENSVALVGDIKKMFQSVYLQDLEKHCHRFL